VRYWTRERLTLRLDAVLVDRLDVLAEMMRLTRTAVVRLLLDEGLLLRERAWEQMLCPSLVRERSGELGGAKR
jgi:predicted transcriptional regulator